MKYKNLFLILLILLIPLAVTAAIALASGLGQDRLQNHANLLPSQPFTYQGELLDDDQPEPGPCDFQFGLWDATTLGSQVGMTQTLTSIPLDSGRFSVVLNDDGQIGASPFDGQALWMAIDVDCPSGIGSYVSLTPRQRLTAAPYAYFSTEASFAPWAGISAKPDGFADDIDDDTLYDAGTGLALITTTFDVESGYRLPQDCDTGHLVEWSGSSWGCLEPTEPGYANVVVVAKSGGDFETIQDGLDSIIDASSENRYLVWVAPGVYSETVDMISWVDIEGVGEDLTRIESEGFPGSGGTVTAAANSELRFLAVENIGKNAFAIAIRSAVDEFTLSHVTALASGGTTTNWGVFITGGPLNNKIENTTISVDAQLSSSGSRGLYISANSGDIAVAIDGLLIEANSTVDETLYGVQLAATSSFANIVTATNVVLDVHGTGTATAYGFRNHGQGTQLTISNSSITDYGFPSYGMYILGGSTIVARNIDLSASHTGIFVTGPGNPNYVAIDNSTIEGGSYAARIINGTGNAINFGTSLIDGTILAASGNTITCVNSYDENYTNINGFDACP